MSDQETEKKKGMRRSVLLPGENSEMFNMAMLESGKSEKEFREHRLLLNGWTEQDEQTFLMNLSAVGKFAQLGPDYS